MTSECHLESWKEPEVAQSNFQTNMLIVSRLQFGSSPISAALWGKCDKAVSDRARHDCFSVSYLFFWMASMKFFRNLVYIQICSDNLISELPNAPHSCSQQVPDAAWLVLAWPGDFIPVPKTSLLGVQVHCLSQWNSSGVKFCVFS